MASRHSVFLAAVATALVVSAATGCSKDKGKQEIRTFVSEFQKVRDGDVNTGFFQCLYGEKTLPAAADAFIEQITRRFESDAEGFLQEKSAGCKANLEGAITKLRALTGPNAEISAALATYAAALDDLAGAWDPVHKAMQDFQAVQGRRVAFNATYAPLLEKCGNRGWAVIQKFEKVAEVDAFLAQDPNNVEAVDNAYRYLNFVLCILKAYNVDPRTLLIEDTTAAAEGRSYLKGVAALADKLRELCSGEPGTQTHVLEWSARMAAQCYPQLDAPTVQRPDQFEQIMLWWSSDGGRDASGRAYSSYAEINECLKKEVDIAPPLRDFLKVYGDYATAANALEQAIARAIR